MAINSMDVQVEYLVAKIGILDPRNSGKTLLINRPIKNCGNAFSPGFKGDRR